MSSTEQFLSPDARQFSVSRRQPVWKVISGQVLLDEDGSSRLILECSLICMRNIFPFDMSSLAYFECYLRGMFFLNDTKEGMYDLCL